MLVSVVFAIAQASFALHVWDENYRTEPYFVKSKNPLVIQYDNGLILDLPGNVIVARGEYPLTGFGAKSKEYTENNATINSKKALADLSGQLRINADERLGYLTSNDQAFASKIDERINSLSKAMHYRILPMKMVLRVTTSAKLSGKNGLLGEIYTYLAGLNPSGTPAQNDQASGETNSPNPSVKVNGGYTGLVIDATGLKLEPAIDPVIKDESGNMILGKVTQANLDVLSEKPKIGYAHTLKEAYSNKHIGKYPLVIKAKSAVKNCDPVVSDEDGARIQTESNAAGFLKALNIVFVI